jgi:hypothetical protein
MTNKRKILTIEVETSMTDEQLLMLDWMAFGAGQKLFRSRTYAHGKTEGFVRVQVAKSDPDPD